MIIKEPKKYIVKHTVNHARARRRIKAFKMQMLVKQIGDRKLEKTARATRKNSIGITITGQAKGHAVHVKTLDPMYDDFDNQKIRGHKNQRQRRKIWRQAPHMRKKWQ